VHIACKLSPQRIWFEITDEGPGFDPADVPDPTNDDNLDYPSGRGIMLMRSFMCRVEYNASGNCVVMEKHRSRAG
jgi:serine/threonine-protein kinase RsbW